MTFDRSTRAAWLLSIATLVGCGSSARTAGDDGALGTAGGSVDAGTDAEPASADAVATMYAVALAVDATRLYANGGAALVALPKSGGTPSTLVTSSGTELGGFALGDDAIYYADVGPEEGTASHGVIAKLPNAGGAAVTLASEQSYPGAVALDEGFVYFTADGEVRKVARDGSGGVVTIASAQTFAPELASARSVLAVGGGWVYWATTESTQFGVRRAALDGSTIESFVTTPSPARAIAPSGATVYVACGSVPGVDVLGASGSILAVPASGGAAAVLAKDQADPSALVIDDAYAYWTNWGTVVASGVYAGESAILRLPLAGGAPESVATADAARALALDAADVYWSQSGAASPARIRKTPKTP